MTIPQILIALALIAAALILIIAVLVAFSRFLHDGDNIANESDGEWLS